MLVYIILYGAHMSKKLIYEIDINEGNSVKTLNSLEKELKDVNDELKNVEIGSDSFNKLASQSKLLQGQIEGINNSVKGLELSDKIMAGDGAIKILAGSVQGLVGSLGILGVESEAIGKFEEKAASAISLGMGLKDVSEGVGQLGQVMAKLPGPTQAATIAQKALNTVMRMNPIGLIITAITVVVGLFLVFNKRIREVISTFEPLNKLIDGAVGLFRKLGQTLGFVASDAEMLAQKQRELAQATADSLSDTLRIQKAFGNDTIELERRILNERIKATEEFSDERKKAVVDLQVFEAEQVRKAQEDEKKREQESIARLKEATQKRKEALEERKRALEEIEKASITNAAEQFAFELKQVEKEYDELIKVARKYGQSTEALEIARQIKLAQIRKEYNDQLSEEEAAKLEQLRNLNEQLFDLQAQYVADEQELLRINDAKRAKDLENSYNELRDKTTEFYNEQFAAAIGNADKQAEIIRDRDNEIALIEQERLIAQLAFEDTIIAERKARQKALDEEEKARLQELNQIFFDIEKQRVEQTDELTKFGREERLRIRLEDLELEKQAQLQKLTDLQASEQQITEVTKFYADEGVRIKAEAAEQEKQIEIAKREAILGATAGLFGAIGGLLKEGSKEAKAFAVTDSIIQTYLGVAKALGSAPPPINFITAASVAAAGIANVRKILSTNVGGGTPQTPSRPSLPTGGVNPAQFATAQTPSITQFQTGFGPNNQQFQRQEPVRAYVIAGDVSSGLEAENKIRTRRTVGRPQ